ncbi:hypothetical protein SUGI_1021580 [Cryptomeria japonica]|nr:hypothetical protein SUGI_1021580 [Cryptomeria japonica]
MECYQDEARKAKELAEKKFDAQDLEGARKMVLKAQNIYPLLEGLTQFIAVLNVHLAAAPGQKTKGLVDYYKVLDVGTDAQVSVIRKQYRKLALLLHPDKNNGVGAERAFKLVAEAWGILSDETKKAQYDKMRSGLRRPFRGNAHGNWPSSKEVQKESQRCSGQSVYFASSTETIARFVQQIFDKMDRRDFEQSSNQGFSEAFGAGTKRKNNGNDDDNEDDDCIILEDGFGKESVRGEPCEGNSCSSLSTKGNEIVTVGLPLFTDQIKPQKNCGEESGGKTHKTNSLAGKVNRYKKEKMMTVPDADFYDFDGDRAEESFEANQIWAAYDDEDGMPRFYARIRSISSFHPFKVQITWLDSLLNNEPALIKWHKSGFYKGCGDFKFVNGFTVNSVNVFSHIMRWERSKGGVKIMPRRGDVWALYRDWSPDWDKSTPEEIRHNYLLVEILSDSANGVGIEVVPLVKVEKYRTLFQRVDIEAVTEKNMLRFSHKVPAHRLKGNDALHIPRDCWELDPAALPADMVQEGVPQTGNN